jgi:hypothetical protein
MLVVSGVVWGKEQVEIKKPFSNGRWNGGWADILVKEEEHGRLGGDEAMRWWLARSTDGSHRGEYKVPWLLLI